MICFAGVRFIHQNTLCVAAFSHGFKPVGSRQHGQGGYEFYPRATLLHRAKPFSPCVLLWLLLTRRASLSALKITGAGASGAACLARSSGGASICVWGRAALSIKGGDNNGGLGLFHLQPVTLYLVTTPARNPP